MAMLASNTGGDMAGSGFSYAQAARRSATVQTTPQPSATPASPSVSSQSKNSLTVANTSISTPSGASTEVEHRERAVPTAPADRPGPKRETEAPLASFGNSSQSVIATSSASRPADESECTVVVTQEEKSPRSTSRTSRTNDGPDHRKGRKGKKSRNSEKDTEQAATQEPAEKEKETEKEASKPALIEAAPPPVNFWTKRAAEAASRTKPASAPTASAATRVPGTGQDAKKLAGSSLVENSHALPNGVSAEKPQHAPRKAAELSQVTEKLSRKAPRGSRMIEKEDNAGAPPPAVRDTSAFPDLKASLVSEGANRRPATKPERVEKEGADDCASGKKREKKEWQSLDFVPTAVFETPIPTRPSKSSPAAIMRGGRETGTTKAGGAAGAGAGAVTTDSIRTFSSVPISVINTDKGAPAGLSTAPTRPNEGRQRGGSFSARAPAGASMSGSTAPKRLSVEYGPGKEQNKAVGNTSSSDRQKEAFTDVRLMPNSKGDMSRSPLFNSEASITGPGLGDERQHVSSGSKGGDYANYAKYEGRYSKTKNGYRGPAQNGSGVQSTGYANGHYHAQSYGGGRHPYSPNSHQGGFPSYSGRGGRHRVNSSPSGRMPNGSNYPAKGSQQANAVSIYDYSMMAISPTAQYPFDLTQVVRSQVEYYLSVDNLCKDNFLRKHMDSQGFVPLSFIAGFNRLQALTPEIDLVRHAVAQSETLEYVMGNDNVERLRLRDQWKPFVLDKQVRESSAQNDGPTEFYPRNYVSQTAGLYVPTMYQMPPYASYPPADPMHRSGYSNGAPYDPSMDGADTNGHYYTGESQLSATVPEFSPVAAAPPLRLEDMTKFPDKSVERLTVIFSNDSPTSSVEKQPSFSDEAAGFKEPQALQPQPNGVSPSSAQTGSAGETTTDGADKPYVNGGHETSTPPQTPPMTWATNNAAPTKSGSSEYLYPQFRIEALEQRRRAQPGHTPVTMKSLYKFWSVFLVQDFNDKLYDEFRLCALEDARSEVPTKVGLRYLIHYYCKLLHGSQPKPWGSERSVPEIITLHYQEALSLDPTWAVNNELKA